MLIYSVVKVLRLYGIPKHSSQVEHILRDISICKYLGSKGMGGTISAQPSSKEKNMVKRKHSSGSLEDMVALPLTSTYSWGARSVLYT